MSVPVLMQLEIKYVPAKIDHERTFDGFAAILAVFEGATLHLFRERVQNATKARRQHWCMVVVIEPHAWIQDVDGPRDLQREDPHLFPLLRFHLHRICIVWEGRACNN